MVKQTTMGADENYIDAKIGLIEVVAIVDNGAMVTTPSAEVLDRSTGVAARCD